MIDRLWNRFVAAWYEGGKDDPKLALPSASVRNGGDLAGRLEPPLAGIKLLLGADPKEDYKDNVAEVDLRR